MQGQNDHSASVDSLSDSRSNLGTLKRFDLALLVLVFALLLVFSLHNFDSIGQDVGRHLKIGEIIWQTKAVPQTNLFSFTEPNFPFSNHHWLSEVIFYKLFVWFGLTGLILLKAALILAAFLLLFFIFLPRSDLIKFWPVLISFLLSLFIFISRTEVRPEIFSFVILAFFLFVLFREKYKGSTLDLQKGRTLLWFLPLAQLLWVNLHIYFFIGPFLMAAFFVDRLISLRFDLESLKRSNLKMLKVFFIGLLVGLATLINPAGIQGALLPFTILKEYGYSIVENQSLAFLAAFFDFNLPIFIFKLSVGILAAAFLLTIKKTKQRVFEMIISIFFIYAGFRMLRNLPLYALASFPILSLALTNLSNFLEQNLSRRRLDKLSRFFKWTMAGFLIFMIFWAAGNGYYQAAGLSRAFGFSVPNGLERAVNFVKENKIEGPMFNNFDIGGYLIWKLYPQEKVFVDNRPEAYSVNFFSEIYKPMQEDKEKWAEFSEQYGINFIFFGHTDATPWGQAFLKNIVKDPQWKMVYLNENAIVFLKDTKVNSLAISRLAFSEKNSVEKTVEFLKDANGNKADVNLVLSRFFYNINWRESSLYFSEEAVKADPKNRQAHLNNGLAHAYYTDREHQELAAERIKKAIELGLKDSRYYSILGVVYMNLGELAEAKFWFNQALKLDKNNKQAKEFINKFFPSTNY